MRKLILPVLLALLATPALAQQAPPPRWTFGVLAVERDAPYRQLDEGLLFAPLVRFEGEDFYLRGLRGGWRMHETETFELALIAQARLDGYKAEDSAFLTGMDDRRASIELGLASTWTSKKIGQLELAVLADALDRSGGFEVAASWNGLFRRGGFTFVPGASLRWQNEDMVDYYFGVREDEALPGRAAYRADAAVTPEISMLVSRNLTPRWTVFGRVGHSWLPSQVTDSPLVDRDASTSVFLGIGYSPE